MRDRWHRRAGRAHLPFLCRVLVKVVEARASEAGLDCGEPRLFRSLHIPVRLSGQTEAYAEVFIEPKTGGEGSSYAETRSFRIGYKNLKSQSPLPFFLSFLEKVASDLRTLEARVDVTWPLETVPGGTDKPVEWAPGEPEEVLVRLEFRCNQRCPFCFVRLHDRRLSPEEVEATLEGLGRRNQTIVLTGGEPTLHPRILEVVKVAKKFTNRPLHLQTNAVRLASPRLAAEIVSSGVASFLVSFHSHLPEQYDTITGSRGQHSRAVKGILNLLRQKEAFVTLNILLSRLNIKELGEYVRFVAALGEEAGQMPSLFITFMNDYGHRKVPDLALPISEIREGLKGVIGLCLAFGIRVFAFYGECALPLCALDDPSLVLPERPVRGVDVQYSTKPMAPLRPGLRCKHERCRSCKLDDFCWGVPGGYAAIFGLEDLSPF